MERRNRKGAGARVSGRERGREGEKERVRERGGGGEREGERGRGREGGRERENVLEPFHSKVVVREGEVESRCVEESAS